MQARGGTDGSGARVVVGARTPKANARLRVLTHIITITIIDRFAVPMRKYGTCDFSFAGLKTSARLAIEQTLSPAAVEGLSPEQVNKVGPLGWWVDG